MLVSDAPIIGSVHVQHCQLPIQQLSVRRTWKLEIAPKVVCTKCISDLLSVRILADKILCFAISVIKVSV